MDFILFGRTILVVTNKLGRFLGNALMSDRTRLLDLISVTQLKIKLATSLKVLC